MDWSDLQIIDQDCKEQFISLPEYAGTVAKSIELAGISSLRTEYRIRRHQNPTHLLFFTVAGGGKLTLPDRTEAIPEHTVMVLPAGSSYLFEIDQPDWHSVWFLCRDNEHWQRLSAIPAGVYDCREAHLIRELLALIVEQHHLYAPPPADLEAGLLNTLARYLDNALAFNNEHNRQQGRLLRLFESVKSQLHLHWTSGKLADAMYLSEPHFFRLCQQVLGKSPMQYITELRMNYACELLKHTNLTVEQIGQRLAYQNGSSFSMRFKKHFGIAPALWRAAHR